VRSPALAVPIGTDAIQDWPGSAAWTAAPIDNVERTKAPATAVTTCAKRSVLNMVGLRNLALPPAHPTVMPLFKHGACQNAEMAEIREFLKRNQAVRH
jgi:hypothetical protein